jgi:hypothetical protein
MALLTLGINSAMVLDCGYRESLVLPVSFCQLSNVVIFIYLFIVFIFTHMCIHVAWATSTPTPSNVVFYFTLTKIIRLNKGDFYCILSYHYHVVKSHGIIRLKFTFCRNYHYNLVLVYT